MNKRRWLSLARLCITTNSFDCRCATSISLSPDGEWRRGPDSSTKPRPHTRGFGLSASHLRNYPLGGQPKSHCHKSLRR